MVNKDYILRMYEQMARTLAIILGLRKQNKHEDALIYIDNLLLQTTGFTSSFIDSVSEEVLLKTLSPFGTLNIDKCLWIAFLLKAEGEVYEDQGNTTASYYRYLKGLHLYLSALVHERFALDSDIYTHVRELLDKLAEYELPLHTQQKLLTYYEYMGLYDKAENVLFEILDTYPTDTETIEQGRAFYERLLKKSDADLLAGNFSRDEVGEGLTQLDDMERHQ